METKSKGECIFCNSVFSGSSMSRHLDSCSKRKDEQTKENPEYKIYLLKVYADPFWIYLALIFKVIFLF